MSLLSISSKYSFCYFNNICRLRRWSRLNRQWWHKNLIIEIIKFSNLCIETLLTCFSFPLFQNMIFRFWTIIQCILIADVVFNCKCDFKIRSFPQDWSTKLGQKTMTWQSGLTELGTLQLGIKGRSPFPPSPPLSLCFRNERER